MLEERQPVRHVRRTALPTFFLFLVLISLSFVNGYGAASDQESSTIYFSAGSVIPTAGTYIIENILPGKSPDRCRIELLNPSRGIVYKIDSETDYKEDLGYGKWRVRIDDKGMHVPAFPTVGMWTLKIIFYSGFFFLENICAIAESTFNVGESSLIDNIMAPIYLTWEGIIVGWGAFSIALPGLFWISSPFWALALLFIILVFYVRSIKVAVSLIKEGGSRFKKALKGGEKT